MDFPIMSNNRSITKEVRKSSYKNLMTCYLKCRVCKVIEVFYFPCEGVKNELIPVLITRQFVTQEPPDNHCCFKCNVHN